VIAEVEESGGEPEAERLGGFRQGTLRCRRRYRGAGQDGRGDARADAREEEQGYQSGSPFLARASVCFGKKGPNPSAPISSLRPKRPGKMGLPPPLGNLEDLADDPRRGVVAFGEGDVLVAFLVDHLLLARAAAAPGAASGAAGGALGGTVSALAVPLAGPAT
jgi:hypothetical protein